MVGNLPRVTPDEPLKPLLVVAVNPPLHSFRCMLVAVQHIYRRLLLSLEAELTRRALVEVTDLICVHYITVVDDVARLPVCQEPLDAIQQRLGEFEPRDLVILYGVMTDKSELLTGNATGRTEVVSITEGFDDHERQTLHDAIAAELERREVEA